MEMLVAKLGPRADEQIRAEIQKLAQTAGALSRETNGLMKELVTLSNEQVDDSITVEYMHINLSPETIESAKGAIDGRIDVGAESFADCSETS